jgi:hypothetical protein
VLSVSKRIWYSKKQAFPENYIDSIITLLQSSSVPQFNEQFRNVALKRASDLANERVHRAQGRVAPAATYANDLITVETLLNMASTFYEGYSREGVWHTHVKTKSAAASPAGHVNQSAMGTGTCFNCGSKDHMLPECPKDVDQVRIDANKKKYIESKKKLKDNKKDNKGKSNGSSNKKDSGSNGSSTGRLNKWRPPDEGGKDQRFIWTHTHGKQPYKWNATTHRWDIMVTIPASNNGANSGASANTASTGTTTTGGEAAANAASAGQSMDVRAQLAELQRQFQKINDQL